MKSKKAPLSAKRRSRIYYSEKGRVITRVYLEGSEDRVKKLIDRVLSLKEEKVVILLEQIMDEFSDRHRHFREKLEGNYNKIKHYMPDIPRKKKLSTERRLLIAAYFTCEYSVESAALFNPSVVPHPDQSEMSEGSVRFIMSFRATGEGHISSIEFRSGVIDKHNDIFFDALSPYVETPEIHTDLTYDITYDRHLFQLKLNEMGAANEVTEHVLNKLRNEFTYNELESRISTLSQEVCFLENVRADAVTMMRWLAKSNYEIKFHPDHRVSERVIFPVSENESRGIEDARFVRFVDDDGAVTYYATYTAYNGVRILPQLIETKDFVTFKIITLNGNAVQNKGMALFPRRINGKFVMLSRQDGVNNHIMYSDNLHFWQESTIIQEPELPWEFIQVGNCGPPMETDAGWILLIHGVGPMRKYSMGVQLLDLNDPSKIIGRLNEPILVPNEQEREGYVPNVVYSCGAIIHNDELIIPYAMADSRCGIATLSVPELLSRFK